MAAYENWHVEIDFGTGYTDVTADVDTVVSPVDASIGDAAETSDEPGHMTIVLENVNHKYSPGNAESTLALQTGMPIRLFETIGPFRFDLHTGTIEFPEISDLAFPVRDQQIVVLSVDQLSRWERSPTFVSTLGAYVMGNGGDELTAHWPCNDPTGSTAIGSTTTVGPLRVVSYGTANADLLDLAIQPGPAGEDTSFLTLAPATANGATTLRGTTSSFVDFASNEVTVAFWMRGTGATINATVNVRDDALTTAILVTASATQWQLDVVTGAGSTSVVMSRPPTPDRWQFVSARLNNLTGACDLYVDDVSVSGAVASGTSTGHFDTTILQAVGGVTAFGHVQVYAGAVSTWTQTRHLAQYNAGLTGLERQSTGARIRTIGGYAGLTAAQMAGVDEGCSVMSRAQLAGKTIAAAMYEARDTERGRLFMAGDGSLTFHDRRTVLNV